MFGNYYFGDRNIADLISKYGNVIAVVPKASSDNGGINAYMVNHNDLRALHINPSGSVDISVTFKK